MKELPNEEANREDRLAAEDVAPEPETDPPPALGRVAVQGGRVGGGAAQKVDQLVAGRVLAPGAVQVRIKVDPF